MSFLDTREIAFGLDISPRSLRLIQLARRGKKNIIQLYNEIKLPPDCIKAGEILNAKVFLDALNKLIKTRHGRGRLSEEVVAVLPEDQTYLKVMELTTPADADLGETIKLILPQNIPVSWEDVYCDWQKLTATENSQTVIVGVTPKKIVNSYVDVLSQAGLIPTVLEIEAAAVSRLLVELAGDKAAQIIIDLGANRSGLSLYDQGTIQFTISLPISGNKITQTIVSTLDLDAEQAEQAKIVCGLDQSKGNGALLEIFAATIDELADHIQQAIDFYHNTFAGPRQVEKILLCGGGSNLLNISKVLGGKLSLPVAIADPWQNIANPDKIFFTSGRSQSFVTALGLALRGLNPDSFL